VSTASPEGRFSSLFVLTSLCRENPVVSAHVISQWSEAERKAYFAQEAAGVNEEAKMEVRRRYYISLMIGSSLVIPRCVLQLMQGQAS
jgi:hypothetical protein